MSSFQPEPSVSEDKLKLIHLVGSTKDDYYTAISVFYAKQMVESTWHVGMYDFQFAHVSPDGTWKFPSSLDREDIKSATSYSLCAAIQHIQEVLKPDVMIPHMYCPDGMTTYRALFESLLNIPYVGLDSAHMALTTDKALTRAVVSEAGVQVPEGIAVQDAKDARLGALTLPLIVKPACEDNSIGLALCHTQEELDKAVENALTVDSKVMVEQFIPPGTEIRVGIIENLDGTLSTLPKYEYFVSKNDPIRTMAHKYSDLDDNKELRVATGNRACPAPSITPEIAAELDRQALIAFRALKSRDYNLFDFRVDPDGQCYFLEACPYVAFAPECVLVAMSNLTELRNPVFFQNMVELAQRRKKPREQYSSTVDNCEVLDLTEQPLPSSVSRAPHC